MPGGVFAIPRLAQMLLVVDDYYFQFRDNHLVGQRSKSVVNNIDSPGLDSLPNYPDLVSLGASLADQKIKTARRATSQQKQNYQTSYESHKQFLSKRYFKSSLNGPLC